VLAGWDRYNVNGLSYVIKLADSGLDAGNSDSALKRGVNVIYGSCTCEPVAQSLELKDYSLESVLVLLVYNSELD
jgi:alanine dehydrogenase